MGRVVDKRGSPSCHAGLDAIQLSASNQIAKIPGDDIREHLCEGRPWHYVIASGLSSTLDEIRLNVRDKSYYRDGGECGRRFEEGDHFERIKAIRVEVDDRKRRWTCNQPLKLVARFHSFDLTPALRGCGVDLRGEEHIVDKYHYCLCCHGEHSSGLDP